MRPSIGMSLAAMAVRLALAVPVFVEGPNGLDGVLRETQQARDVGAAFAPRSDHFACALRSSRQHGQRLPDAAQPELARCDVADDEAAAIRATRVQLMVFRLAFTV